MPLDPYALCPCGSGKKLKFCCHDLAPELEKIQRMSEGEQYQACLAHVERLLVQHPGRASLLAHHAELLEALGRNEEAERVYAELGRLFPANTLAMARQAEYLAQRGQSREAIAMLQRAIAANDDGVPNWVAEAIGTVATLLAAAGHALAATGHVMLHLALVPDDQQSQRLLFRLQAAELPLVMKQSRQIVDMPSVKAAAEGLALARRGAWQAALDKLAPLSKKFADSVELWQNLATMRIWLHDDVGAADALRAYARLDIPWDDAVEAEALAQLLTPVPESEQIPLVEVEFPVHDQAQLLENLANEARLSKVDLEQLPAEDAPPPLAVYHVLDRPMPPAGAELTDPDEVPCVLGQIEFFGRETNREARLVLAAARDERLNDVKELIGQHGFGLVGPAGEPQVLNPAFSFRGSMARRWNLPEGLSPEAIRALSRQHHERTYGQRFAQTPSWVLGGQTPAQAARDPKQHLAVAAMILLLESGSEAEGFDFNHLRQDLGVPTLESIPAAGLDVKNTPPIRYARIDAADLSDEQLKSFFYAAAAVRADQAVRKFATEVLNRESLLATPVAAQACELLARMAADVASALSWIDRGRAIDKDQGRSCARWDLQELRLQIAAGNVAEFERLVEHLSKSHAREPSVRDALMRILVEVGAITPDGRVVGRQPAPAETESGLIVPESAAAEPGQIWTPDSERPAAGRSALWTPESG